MNDSKNRIIFYLLHNKAFTFITPELKKDIPVMFNMLTESLNNDIKFYDKVQNIRNNWQFLFTNAMRHAVNSYVTEYLRDLTVKANLIEFAQTHPDVVMAQNEELNDITGELNAMMDPIRSLTRDINKTKLSGFKRPRKQHH
jgi:hypothetical protein